jgi:hypothetical protein
VITRHSVTWQYQARQPRRVAVPPVAIVHADAREGMTPVSAPLTGWSSDGAPYYNSGYAAPYYGAVQIGGGSPVLALPRRSEQLDLTDMDTWDRPVVFTGPGAR